MRRSVALASVLILALLFTACAQVDPAKEIEEQPSYITIKTQEYAFAEIPGTFKGGRVTILLDNTSGKESHEAEMVRLDPGKSVTDLVAAEEGPPPPWAHAAGGPGPVAPGKKATYTANLEAGTYAFVCHVPAPDGVAHMKKGMVAQANVTEGKDGSLAKADGSVSAKEFAFSGVDKLRAGEQTVKFENQGKQAHHAAVFSMAPGKSAQDLAAFFNSQGPPSGPPPFTGISGLVGTLPPGGEATRTLELEAGTTYVFVCFIPDVDGTPHFAKGMSASLTPS